MNKNAKETVERGLSAIEARLHNLGIQVDEISNELADIWTCVNQVRQVIRDDAEVVDLPYAPDQATRCTTVAGDGSLACGTQCLLLVGHGGAHVYGTAAWEHPHWDPFGPFDQMPESIRRDIATERGWARPAKDTKR
jgi:hypothetical protein